MELLVWDLGMLSCEHVNVSGGYMSLRESFQEYFVDVSEILFNT
jgi:hypothetical protein